MFLVLKGGRTTLVSLISAIVPYLRHDIKPNCQSKPKQILLEELQNGKRSIAALRGAASNMADTNLGRVDCEGAEQIPLNTSHTIKYTARKNKHNLLLADSFRR